MNLDDARSRLGEQYTVMRADPFITDAGLWLALGDLAHAIRDAYTTRLAWENATSPAVAAELERVHRRVHRDLTVKLGSAASAAGIDGATESVSEAPPLASWPGRHERDVDGLPRGRWRQHSTDPHRAGGGL